MGIVIGSTTLVGMFATLIAATAPATQPTDEFNYKQRLLPILVEAVPGLLKTYDKETGQFGEGIWTCRDQERMYPLAVAYATPDPDNPYYKDQHLLEVITKAGDALIEDADETGQWVFRKKDGSTWGSRWMPWTYSRWIRTYGLIREDMEPTRRQAWADALTLGYEGISATQLRSVHNIPAHQAMGLYVAGQVLERPEWSLQASAFMMQVVQKQSEGGYWSEHRGPVVVYNAVYTDVLGTYHALSGDERVLAALEKAALFHYHFRYPNGHNVETIDERNPYRARVETGNVGFTTSPLGRLYLAEQWEHAGWENLAPDLIASLILYGREGSLPDRAGIARNGTFVLAEDDTAKAATFRRGPWFACLSAYTSPVVNNRWIQDRQNLVSIYHDRVGLIVGGGNTKLQPAWSTFTVGDTSLLQHTPGDTRPNFQPKGELFHVPSEAELRTEPKPALTLTYGPAQCRAQLRFVDDDTLEYVVAASGQGEQPAAAHVTLIPRIGESIATAAGIKTTLSDEPIEWSADQVGGRLLHGGFVLELPPTASVHWPALPHIPYRKDGHAEPSEGRIVVRVPLDSPAETQTVRIRVEPQDAS